MTGARFWRCKSNGLLAWYDRLSSWLHAGPTPFPGGIVSQGYSAVVDIADGGGGGCGCSGSPPCDGARPRLFPTVRTGLLHGHEGEDASGQERRRVHWLVKNGRGLVYSMLSTVCRGTMLTTWYGFDEVGLF